MTTEQNRAASALLVHAHPEPTSFCASQADVAWESLIAQGYRVDVVDLYARGWQPVLSREEFPSFFDGPFKPQLEQQKAFREGCLPPDVREDLDKLLGADLLVLSFPLWFSLLAILKGWVDRVFVMGAVASGDAGVFGDAALAGRRAVVLTTTGGSAEMFTDTGLFGATDDFLFHVNRGILEFVGYEALEPVVTYGPAHLDRARRADALDDVRRAFDTIDERPAAATSRPYRPAASR